jgi:predicted nucleic acid-binding protein
MVFVDTSAWFAAIVPSDPNHTSAAHWLAVNAEVLITTDYIVDEALTLLRARGERQRAKLLGKKFFKGSIADLLPDRRRCSGGHGPHLLNTKTRVGALPTVPAKLSWIN